MAREKDAEWIELSHPINEGAIRQPGLPQPTFRSVDDSALRATEYTIATHVGTHIEAPSHLEADGKTIDEYPPKHFMNRAYVLSVDVGALEPIPVDQVSDVDLREGDALIFRTGWEHTPGEEMMTDQPYLSEDLAEWLVERGVSWIGVDSPSPEMPSEIREEGFDYPVHSTLLDNDVLIVEFLTNLRSVENEWIDVVALPLPLEDVDGAQARVVGRIRND